jgi:IS30 family transposase
MLYKPQRSNQNSTNENTTDLLPQYVPKITPISAVQETSKQPGLT